MKVENKRLRPFSLSAQVKCRSYSYHLHIIFISSSYHLHIIFISSSYHLQRAIVDFGADVSFQDACLCFARGAQQLTPVFYATMGNVERTGKSRLSVDWEGKKDKKSQKKPETEEKEAPVEVCYRYISNREDCLDYKYALENDLPIGSGEIESSYRYVIQKRLKIVGAWWKPETAEYMLSLRTLRANGDWNRYWICQQHAV